MDKLLGIDVAELQLLGREGGNSCAAGVHITQTVNQIQFVIYKKTPEEKRDRKPSWVFAGEEPDAARGKGRLQ